MKQGMGRVLFIDDSAMARTMVAGLLEGAGHRIEAWDPPPLAQFYLRARAFGPQLILLDYSMPKAGYDGLQLLRKIRVFWPELPVVLLSAHQEAEVLARFWQADITLILPKPQGFKVLVSVVDRLLGDIP